jgi:hypothetical protein
MKTQQQIEDALGKVESSQTRFPGMSYEQGIEEALSWVLGEIPDNEFGPLAE